MREQGVDSFIEKDPNKEQIFNLVVDAICEVMATDPMIADARNI